MIPNPNKVTLLGSTGSIGVNTLTVIQHHRKRYEIIALTANTQVERMAEQCREWQPRYAVMVNEIAAEQLQQRIQHTAPDTTVLTGQSGLLTIAQLPVDTVMAAIVGGAGLLPTLTAVAHCQRLLLANKEALVMAGKLFMNTLRAHGTELIPIDSEHNALFQALALTPSELGQAGLLDQKGVSRLLLTASGGPFLHTSDLSQVTPEQACAHPNWVMGRKISVDSASMMNKGLEVIEACWLFAADTQQVQVLIHPQSIIHSLVDYQDGSTLAHLGNPDMKVPISHALGWPERIHSKVNSLNLLNTPRLEFLPVDPLKFPCLNLAIQAHNIGGTAPVVLNAANEIAVAAFLERKIPFTTIPQVIEKTLAEITPLPITNLEVILAEDAKARDHASTLF